MSEHDTRAELFFAELTAWRQELLALRAILRDCPLTERFKWTSPVYTLQDANVAILWSRRDCAALGIFKGVLLKDSDGLLVAPGQHSRSMRVARFADVQSVAEKEMALKSCVLEAIEIERAGLKVDFSNDSLDYPEELRVRMGRDPELKAAFLALTPGRQRGYCLHFASAKQSGTRTARIEKFRPRILAGKGLQER